MIPGGERKYVGSSTTDLLRIPMARPTRTHRVMRKVGNAREGGCSRSITRTPRGRGTQFAAMSHRDFARGFCGPGHVDKGPSEAVCCPSTAVRVPADCGEKTQRNRCSFPILVRSKRFWSFRNVSAEQSCLQRQPLHPSVKAWVLRNEGEILGGYEQRSASARYKYGKRGMQPVPPNGRTQRRGRVEPSDVDSPGRRDPPVTRGEFHSFGGAK